MTTYLAGPAAGIRHPAARVAALRANPTVALVIDTETSPPQSLTIRGRARIAVRPTWVGLLDFAEWLPSPRGGVQEVAP